MALTYLYTVLLFPATRAKYAIGAIKKKLNDKNPHVALYGFEVSVVYLCCLDHCRPGAFKQQQQKVNYYNICIFYCINNKNK